MDVGAITVTGLVSDLDIAQIITQLAQIRQRPINLLIQRQESYAQNLTVFGQLTAKVMALGTVATGLSDGGAFAQVAVTSSDTSSVVATGSSGAAPGQYQVQVVHLAQNHKISSGSVSASDEALGYDGEVLVNGAVISIAASDTLEDIRDAINAAGAGATASILTISDTDHRLIVRSNSSGADAALQLADASSADILEGLGLVTGSTSVKTPITDGAASVSLSDRLTAVGGLLGLSDPPAGTVQINGQDVAIDLASNSLQDIADAIDALDGVSATVASSGGTSWRIEITGEAGTPTFSDSNNVLVALGVLAKDLAHEVDAAQDAELKIDGVTLTRSSNAVDDAIENVQLQLLAETGESAVRVNVARNLDATVAEVETFVSRYNDVIAFINTNQEFDSETGEGGAFLGNLAVVNLESSLRAQVTGLVNALGQSLQLASQVGITTDQQDRLVLSSSQLRSALQSDPVGVERLFGKATATTSAQVQYYSSTAATSDSGPDGWAVNITQAAERATALSASLPGGITVDEMLTIGGKSVALTAGMSLDDAADLLNSLFTAQHLSLEAGVVGDRLQIQHELWGASHGAVITSSLDDGSGGTDLGGATAGVAQNYVGEDVAGTIGDMSCTGKGRLLTAAQGTAAAGLTLLVTAETAGDLGVVRVSKGIASRLADYISAATDAKTGSLTRAAEGITAEIEAIDEEIAHLDDEVNRYIQKLQLDFARMEMQMSQSKSLMDWMTLQIDYLPGYNGWQNQS
ncbi:MAG TPA: flagellar filament capping protein FliD [Armatimonadota bacterium]|nr:flagellar filament capping protein FliD [Armatimonadota bacterium]